MRASCPTTGCEELQKGRALNGWEEYFMNELPKRKSVRLKDFDYSSNGAYFITVCVKDKQQMLGQIVGRDALIAPEVELSINT